MSIPRLASVGKKRCQHSRFFVLQERQLHLSYQRLDGTMFNGWSIRWDWLPKEVSGTWWHLWKRRCLTGSRAYAMPRSTSLSSSSRIQLSGVWQHRWSDSQPQFPAMRCNAALPQRSCPAMQDISSFRADQSNRMQRAGFRLIRFDVEEEARFCAGVWRTDGGGGR